MSNTEWILLDTEVNGIKAPIYVVELAAQRMRGWQPAGEPFRRLLNHNTDIPPEAFRVNGYTREILERDGEQPLKVYQAFADYVENRPIAAYNLEYDLDRVLRPEWERLGIEAIGQAGFCVLRLAQRLLDPVPAGNHKLQTLRQYYRLPERGAHTALGDVETVSDLMQRILLPLAEQRGLKTWVEIQDLADSVWFPSRIAFGKFKGRLFRDALDEPELHSWLEWLASSSNPRSNKMGSWYLQQLNIEAESPIAGGFVIDSVVSTSSEVVLYQNMELGALQKLIDEARSRLADLETEFTREHHAVNVVQMQLFELMRQHYQKRDELKLVIEYRLKFLDTLMVSGEEEAEQVAPQYEEAKAETDQEYEEAATQAAETHELSEDEGKELKKLFRKLVHTYHPDRFANDPEKQEIYTQLTSEINKARDRGDIKKLREIANDPQGFLLRQGWGSLDFDDGEELSKLQRHFENLQARILDLIDKLTDLRESGDYELFRLSRKNSDFIHEVADQQIQGIDTEIIQLEEEARRLSEEIEMLSGADDPFG